MEILLVLLGVMTAGMLFLGFAALRAASSVRKELSSLDKRITDLSTQVQQQSERIHAVSASLDRRKQEPVFLVADALQSWKSRGVLGTAMLLGVRLFRSYLGSRSPRKALPPPKRP
ncbi:MAG: hypothetical protein IT207_04545 [Fimbriimonadaceae bacterium]|nr:hypothetical protein [Fimbriimonadaceae bacterium]